MGRLSSIFILCTPAWQSVVESLESIVNIVSPLSLSFFRHPSFSLLTGALVM